MKNNTVIAAALVVTFLGAASADAAPVRGDHAAKVSAPVQLVHHKNRGGRPGYSNQWGGYESYRLRPRQIRRSLRWQGYRHIEIIAPRRNVYIARAIGWRGFPVRLVVDAYSGQVLRKRPLWRGYRRHGGYY